MLILRHGLASLGFWLRVGIIHVFAVLLSGIVVDQLVFGFVLGGFSCLDVISGLEVVLGLCGYFS